MYRAWCWVPAGLSGFFVPHITNDLRTTGACGGGFALNRGVYVEVYVEPSDRLTIINRINGVTTRSKIAEYVVENLLQRYTIPRELLVVIDQRIDVPIGGGYGTSGASALGIVVALARSLRIKATLLDLAMIAHEADIINRSGLGTVVGILGPKNGIVLVRKPGGPGLGLVDCIPMDSNLYVVTAFYGAKDKSEILANAPMLSYIRDIGSKALRTILADPSPKTFVDECRKFARNTGLMLPRIEKILAEVEKLEGVIGGSMNMIGDGLFIIVEKNRIEDVLDAIKRIEEPRWIHWFKPGENCELRY